MFFSFQTSPVPLQTGWYYITDNSEISVKKKLFGDSLEYRLDTNLIIGSENFYKQGIKLDSFLVGNNYQYSLIVTCDSIGMVKFKKATGQTAVNRGYLAFIYEDNLIQVIKILGEIPEGRFSISNPNLSKIELEKVREGLKKEFKGNKNELPPTPR